MKIVEVVLESWPISIPEVLAFPLYPFIFYQDLPCNKIRRHEWTHIDQIEREGYYTFHIKNTYNNLVYGYRNNPYEIEARENEYNEEYNPWETR